jgi:hypothetical protein
MDGKKNIVEDLGACQSNDQVQQLGNNLYSAVLLPRTAFIMLSAFSTSRYTC